MPENPIEVQARDTEDFVMAPVSLLNSLRDEIDNLRTQLGLPARQWTSPPSPGDDA
jgi:hypothetical protein